MADRSMTEQQAMQVAAEIVAHLKLVAGRNFPKIDPRDREATQRLVRSYALLISRIHLPQQIFFDAADWLASSDLGDRQILPNDLKQAVWRIRDEWEMHPEKRRVLSEYREQRRHKRNLELLGSEDGRKPLEGEKPTAEQIQATKKRFRALTRGA